MTYNTRRFLIKDIREPQENEFVFGCAERIVASSEFNRMVKFLEQRGFKFKPIDNRSLPDDFHGDRLVGYRIEYEEPKKY